MTKPTPKFKIGDTARTLHWIQGAGSSGIPAESRVRVADVSLEKYGKGRADWSLPRYKVDWSWGSGYGSGLWVYETDLEGMEAR